MPIDSVGIPIRRYGVCRLKGTIAICAGRKWVPIMPFSSRPCTQTMPYTTAKTVPIAAQLGERHAGVAAQVGSARPFRRCSGEGRFQQSLGAAASGAAGKAAGQRHGRPSWRVRTRPFRPFDPCSKMLLPPAPPAGFEPAHTAPEAVALSPELWGLRRGPRARACWAGARLPVSNI